MFAPESNARVTVTRGAVLEFASRWPCSGLPDSKLHVELDGNGDLVEYYWSDPDAEDPEPGKRSLSTLISDAQAAAREGIYVVNTGTLRELQDREGAI